MTLVLSALCAVLFLGAVGMTAKIRRVQEAHIAANLEAQAAVFERTRIEERTRDLLVPLGWIWDHLDADLRDLVPDARLRLYLVATYSTIQEALQADDLEMAEAMEAARLHDAPRRMPRYPQVPAFLARPEDAVSMPAQTFDGYGAPISNPDPAEDLHSFTCTDGHRTTTHQSIDLTGEPCQLPSEEDEGQPCRKVLR